MNPESMILMRIDKVISSTIAILQSDGAHARSLEYEAQRKADHIITEFIGNWSRRLRLPSSNSFEFECTTEETLYITRPDDAALIHNAIAKAMSGIRCKSFIDAFACVGGDTLAAMNQYKDARVYAVQRNTANEPGRFDRLTKNIDTFNKIVKGRTVPDSVVPIGTDIRSFLSSIPADSSISILYLDPPWSLTPNTTRYSTDKEIETFLDQEVWLPLQENRNYPFIIVLKLPRRLQRNESVTWPKLQRNYREHDYIPPRRKFHVYILRLID
jgi:hypothetical protein